MWSIIVDLVASIQSNAEKVSLGISTASEWEWLQYIFGFLALFCLALAAAILTGVGALRGMCGFFFASAVYFLIGGIHMLLAAVFAVVAVFFALLSRSLASEYYESG